MNNKINHLKCSQMEVIHQLEASLSGPPCLMQRYRKVTKSQRTLIENQPNDCPGIVQDEGLKNLMMSWYFAGYYTGLYEGQQRANQDNKS